MATNNVVGTSGDDNDLSGVDGANDYAGGPGNDTIDGTYGQNTIHYNVGDGVDSVKFALPRTYQFADFLSAAQAGLAELQGFEGSSYSNSYFAGADSSLVEMLPSDLQDKLSTLGETWVPGQGFIPGSVDPSVAQATFNSLINWISTPNTNVIQFGTGITLNNLQFQLGALSEIGGQSVPTQFAVAVNPQEGLVFDLGGAQSVAGDTSTPLAPDLTFQFEDGTTATLADLMALPNQGVMGVQIGSEDGESMHGSLGDDIILSLNGDDQIEGGAGADQVFGGDGNDIIDGGDGSDTVWGETGDDVLSAGKGGSFLSGGAGNDVYVFNRGDGTVKIDNGDNFGGPDYVNGSGVDTISFGSNIAPSDVQVSVDSSTGTVMLTVAGTDDSITINWFDPASGAARVEEVVDRVQFIAADGTAHVYDLASLVQAAFPDPSVADPSVSVALIGPDAAELPVGAAGGETAMRYALTGSLFEDAQPNQAPTAAGIADRTAAEDATFTWTMPASAFADPEGGALSLSATTGDGHALPDWLRFDAATGTFSGTPANADVGNLSLTVTATDGGGLSASQTFHIDVQNVNDTPTASDGVAAAAATEDASFNYTLPGDTFNDVDVGDQLTYSAKMANGSALPSWLQIDANTGTLSGTPANEDVGDLSIVVTATDIGGASASKDLAINVANTNDAPTATDGSATAAATEDAAFNYMLPDGTFNDVDAGDKLSYSAKMTDGSNLPGWLQIDPDTGALSGMPANADVGDFSLVVTATDPSGMSASKDLTINVANTNDAPTATDGVAAAAATEDAGFTYTLPTDTFSDVDAGDKLTYSAKMANGAVLPGWLQIDAATGTLSGTPANGDVGSLSVVVTATDLSGTSASKSLDISVANTNDAPTATAGTAAAAATEDATFNYTLPANTFTDVDAGDKLTYSAKMANGAVLPGWLHIDAATGTLSGTPANGDVGSLSVVVTATDLAGISATKGLDISVANTNDAPTVAHAIADQSATEDASFSYVLPANVFSDVDLNDSKTLSATLSSGGALPTWLTFNSATGTFSGTPVNADVGSLSIKVTAKDRAGATVSDTFNLAVANTNDAPTVAHAIADQTATAGSLYSMTVATNTFQDVDAGDSLKLSARLSGGAALPLWLSFDAATGKLSGTPGTAGTWNIDVVATDLSGASTSDSFALTVAAATVNPPVGKTITGGSGNDRLIGTAGDDKINGGKGKDVLSGGAGDDQLFVTADATWGSGSTRTNVVTGEKVSISGKNRIYDVFDGGSGNDVLLGTSGNDALLLDDSKSSYLQSGARIIGVEKIDAGAGDDVVDLTSSRYSYGNVEIDGGSGNDVLWSSKGNDVLRGDSGNDSINGGAGNDYLEGGSGNDKLNGGSGVDILQGGSGNDNLTDTSGNGVLDGGSGDDTLVEGSGNSLLIGGKGNDKLTLGGGYDVIAFNRGDGSDVVGNGGKSGTATLSLGGGINYKDLTLSRCGDDLVLCVGDGDKLTFSKWYDGKKYQAVSKLQVVAETMTGFDDNGHDVLRNDKLQTFDFKGIVQAFDAALSKNCCLCDWSVTNALAQFHMSGSDSTAIGGDLAYQYGANGTLAGIAIGAVQGQVGSGDFAKQAQTLHSQTALKDGLVKLS